MLRIGHRGAAGHAPENTAAALQRAIGLGVDMVEVDVQVTQDGIPVLFHDECLERTSNGRGALGRQPLRFLRRLDCGGWFAPRFRGEPLLTLAEALAICRGRVAVNVELKYFPTTPPGLERAVIHRLRVMGDEHRVIVSSFRWDALARCRQLAPELTLAVLARDRLASAMAAARRLRAAALHLRTTLVTAPLMARARHARLRVHAWTADYPAEIRRLRRLGVDGIVTNYPERLHPGYAAAV